MEKVNKILTNTSYRNYLKKIEECETKRIFCKHDMGHFLDVCRLAEIFRLSLEKEGKLQVQNGEITTEKIYAAGLLHDIGRWQEYESGIRHELASAELSADILRDCGFENNDIEEIVFAIKNHRNKEVKNENSLSGLLYRGDKMSRACFACKAEQECNWSREKKNMTLSY